MNKSAYAAAGVDIEAGSKATELMKTAVQATFGPEVLSGVGAFGGLYSVGKLKHLESPTLVASTDGVGTKTKVAAALNRWDTIGHDIVNHCVNDILVQGARPLFFLDYVASAKLDPEQIATIVAGIAEACEAVDCALLGGETAEMPGVYHEGAIDLVGTVVGVVDRPDIINGHRIEAGDVILGLPSTGLHTNGYTLARQVLGELDWHTTQPALGTTVGEALLAPHRVYLQEIGRLLAEHVDIRGLAHITGGGLIDNPPRIFPDGLGARLLRGSWPEPPIFSLIQQLGEIDSQEMFHVFNMGLGMLMVVPAVDVSLVKEILGDEVYVVGEMVVGEKTVVIEKIGEY
jgi:phosphoribosylformylglycinamidine cyclo-ligase